MVRKKKNNKYKILFRYGLVTIVFLGLAIAVVVKLFDTTIVEASAWNERARKDFNTMVPIKPQRGKILAANGNLLACNIEVYDTKVDLSHGAITKLGRKIPWKSVDSLADSLDRYYPLVKNFDKLTGQARADSSWHKKLTEQLNKKPAQRSKRIMIKRRGSLEDFERIKKFPFFNRFAKYSGFRNPVYTNTHNRRIYPYGSMARRSIGRVSEGKDRQIHGYSGVEYDLDSMLFGKPGWARKVTLTRGVADWVEQPPMEGYDIQTTFDVDLQDILDNELIRVCTEAKAEWGTAILMEVQTGEIKAIANVQDLGNGEYGEALNRAMRGFEPGSVMKPISLMIAFEDGLVKSVNDMVDCSPFQRTSDPHGGGMKTMKQVIEQSSNTGIARVIFRGYSQHPEKYYDRLAQIGFFDPLNSGITYKEVPYMRRLTEFDKRGRHTMTERHLDLARQAYGYTTTIPPIYTLAIYNAIANGGKFVRPRVMKRFTNNLLDSIVPVTYIRERICSEATAEKVRICLHEPVWGEHGTARAVQDDRVEIAGKTGTAYPMKTEFGGGYDTSRRRYAFCGFFPYKNPKYSCMVLILAPSGTSANRTSGQVLKNVALKMHARGMLDNISEFDRTPTDDKPVMMSALNTSVNTVARLLGLRGVKKFKTPQAVGKQCVPDLTGYDAASAVRLLERAGYNALISGQGHVTSQSVAPGTPAAKGTKVRINLSI